jgi:hypothetical protein
MLLVRRRRLGKKVAARRSAERKDLPDKDRSIVKKEMGLLNRLHGYQRTRAVAFSKKM